MDWVFVIATVVLTIVCITLLYFLRKFVLIVMICEDDYNVAIDSLIEAEERLGGIVEIPLFFDSPEVKALVDEAIEEVQLARIEITKAAERFVARSNQKYILVHEEGIELTESDASSLPDTISQGINNGRT